VTLAKTRRRAVGLGALPPIAKRLGGKRPTDGSADKGKITHTSRERKMIAAVTAAIVGQRQQPPAAAIAAAMEALKETGNPQGKPREVGDAGRGANAKKAKEALNRKKAENRKKEEHLESDDEEDDEDAE
jgi:hypothetical protein